MFVNPRQFILKARVDHEDNEEYRSSCQLKKHVAMNPNEESSTLMSGQQEEEEPTEKGDNTIVSSKCRDIVVSSNKAAEPEGSVNLSFKSGHPSRHALSSKRTILTTCEENPLKVREEKKREFRQQIKERRLLLLLRQQPIRHDSGSPVKKLLVEGSTAQNVETRVIKTKVSKSQGKGVKRRTRESETRVTNKRRKRILVFPSSSSDDSDDSADIITVIEGPTKTCVTTQSNLNNTTSIPGFLESNNTTSESSHTAKIRISRVNKLTDNLIDNQRKQDTQDTDSSERKEKKEDMSRSNNHFGYKRREFPLREDTRRSFDRIPGRTLLLKSQETVGSDFRRSSSSSQERSLSRASDRCHERTSCSTRVPSVVSVVVKNNVTTNTQDTINKSVHARIGIKTGNKEVNGKQDKLEQSIVTKLSTGSETVTPLTLACQSTAFNSGQETVEPKNLPRNCSRRSELLLQTARVSTPKAWQPKSFVTKSNENSLHDLHFVSTLRSRSVPPLVCYPSNHACLSTRELEEDREDLSCLFSTKCSTTSSVVSSKEETGAISSCSSGENFCEMSCYEQPVYHTNIMRINPTLYTSQRTTSTPRTSTRVYNKSFGQECSTNMNICTSISVTDSSMSCPLEGPRDPRIDRSKEKSISDAAAAADQAKRLKKRLIRFGSSSSGSQERDAGDAPSVESRHAMPASHGITCNSNGDEQVNTFKQIETIISSNRWNDDVPFGTTRLRSTTTNFCSRTMFENYLFNDQTQVNHITSEALVSREQSINMNDVSHQQSGVSTYSSDTCHVDHFLRQFMPTSQELPVQESESLFFMPSKQSSIGSFIQRQEGNDDIYGYNGLPSREETVSTPVDNGVSFEVTTHDFEVKKEENAQVIKTEVIDIVSPAVSPVYEEYSDNISPQPMVIVSDNDSRDSCPPALPSSSPITSDDEQIIQEDVAQQNSECRDKISFKLAISPVKKSPSKNPEEVATPSLSVVIQNVFGMEKTTSPDVGTLSSKSSDSGKGSSPKSGCTKCKCNCQSRAHSVSPPRTPSKKRSRSRCNEREVRSPRTPDDDQGHRSRSRSKWNPKSIDRGFPRKKSRDYKRKLGRGSSEDSERESKDRPLFIYAQKDKKTSRLDIQRSREAQEKRFKKKPFYFGFPDKDSRVNKTLYVRNLDCHVTDDQLKPIFESHGKVELLFVKRLPTRVLYAFVKYQNLLQAFKAKETLDGMRIGRDNIAVGYAKLSPSCHLWLGNLPKDLDSKFMYQELDRFGQITSMHHYKNDGEVDVVFESVEAAIEAKDGMRGVILGKKTDKNILKNQDTPHDQDPLLGRIRGVVTDFNGPTYTLIQIKGIVASKKVVNSSSIQSTERRESNDSQHSWQSSYNSSILEEEQDKIDKPSIDKE